MKDAVLVLGGAFNPIHRQHVEILSKIKAELEQQGQWRMIGGYFAVAPEGYVRQKMQKRNEKTIKIQHRLALVAEAIREIPWLANSPYQNEMLRQPDGSAFALCQRLKKYFGHESVQQMIVVGADRAVKRGIPIWRRASSDSIIRVAVGRVTEENIDLERLWQDDLRRNLIPTPTDFLLVHQAVGQLSSSIVRQHLQRWVSAANNREEQEQIETDLVERWNYLHQNVMNFIRMHQDDFYLET